MVTASGCKGPMPLTSRILRWTLAGFGVSLALTAGGYTEPARLVPTELLEFCQSENLAAAIAKGNRLGWRRLLGSELEEWRSAFVGSQNMSVEVAGWRNGDEKTGEALNFWVAGGANGYKACNYLGRDAQGIREALVTHYGEPPDASPDLAYWNLGRIQVAYSRTGTVVYVTIAEYSKEP